MDEHCTTERTGNVVRCDNRVDSESSLAVPPLADTGHSMPSGGSENDSFQMHCTWHEYSDKDDFEYMKRRGWDLFLFEGWNEW